MTSRRPPLSLCRWLMLAALALSVVLQPVLGSVSELHELSHGAASVHDISETGAPDEEGNAAGTLSRSSPAPSRCFSVRLSFSQFCSASSGVCAPASPKICG